MCATYRVVMNRKTPDCTDVFRFRLRQQREKKGMKRYVLSELCGLSRPTVGMYERGEIEPTLTALVQLSEKLGVSIDYLAGK